MGSPAQFRRSYRFGLFEADPASGDLLRQGVRVRLQDQPFRVLCLLLERAGGVVTREDLRQALWPADTYVEFDGSLNAALKKLRSALSDPSDNPIFIETVPKRGYRFIAPVTVADAPGHDAKEELPAIAETPKGHTAAGTEGATAISPPAMPSRSGWRTVVYGAGVVVALLLAIVGYASRPRAKVLATLESSKNSPPPVRKSVAVLGFNNTSGRSVDAWLGTAFSEMLSTELAGGEELRLVSGEDVANLRQSSPWSQTGTLDQATTAHLGTVLNTDLLLLGSYTTIGNSEHGQLRLDVRLQDAKTGEILTEVAETGSTHNLFQIASRAGGKLRSRLGVQQVEQADEAGALTALPDDPDAARLYARGLAKLRESDALAAKDLLEQTTKAEPKFPLAHLMLARAWSALGYEQKRKEEAKKALDLSGDLPRVERMQVEGDYYESLPDHDKAASTYRAMFVMFPDNVEYGLQLGETQNAAGHGSQAMETLAQMRNLPPPTSDDPRIDLLEAHATTASVPARVALDRSAQRKAAAQGRKLVYAQARKEECMNLNYSEHPEDALPACEDAYSLFLAAGNRLAAADTVRLIGDCEGSQGHLEQAIATYQRALKTLQELGEHEKTGAVLNNMAINFTNQGKLNRAEQLYREAKSHFEQAGDRGNTATALGNMADILYLRGNLSGAAMLYEQALELVGALDHGNPGYLLYRLSDLELTQGRLKDAHRLAQRALDALRPNQGGYGYLAEALIQMGEVLRAEGDLTGAREQFQAARDMQQKAGDMGLVEESQSELADLAIEERRPSEAESLLRFAITEFEKEKSDPSASAAYTSLSHALLMQGRLEEAGKAVEHGIELSLTSSDPALRLPAAIQKARVEVAGMRQGTASAAFAAARQELRSALATAKKLGYYNLECEARLALGELELKANPATGRSLLRELADDSSSRGLRLMAKKATDLAEGATMVASASAGAR